MASPRQWRDRLQPLHISKMVLPTVNLGPTRLDKIKNLHIEIQANSLTWTLG